MIQLENEQQFNAFAQKIPFSYLVQIGVQIVMSLSRVYLDWKKSINNLTL